MRRLAALLLATSCAAPFTHLDERVEQVASGIYAMHFDTRRFEDEEIAPAASTFVVGSRGVVVIDTGLSHEDGEAILASVARVTDAPVRLVVLTHPSQEGIFGATAFQERGIPVAMHADAASLVAARCAGCLERLKRALGEEAMRGTRVPHADRLLEDGDVVRDAGRDLVVLAPAGSSAPGAIALRDDATSTVIAGSLVSVAAVPALRDADVPRWKEALGRIATLDCAHLVPAYGRPGRCADARTLLGYLDDLDACVDAQLAAGAELGEIGALCDMPRYSGWERYAALHRANAEREYLRLERKALARR